MRCLINIAQRITGNIAVMTITGNMVEDHDTTSLFDRIKYLIDQDVYQVIIDLRDVKWINSNGVGVLMGCLSYLEAHKCELKLVHMDQKVRNVLAVMDILHYFQDFKSVNNALTAGPH
jgi:anti-anti-sigma factor